MIGAIRKRDILAHPFVTVRCFGFPLLLRVLTASRHQTFLSLLTGTGAFRSPTFQVPELFGRCVQLEWRARRIYEALTERFTDQELVGQFFETLAHQEQEHYELLELCQKLAGKEGWLDEHFAPWRDAIPRLERQMDDVEASLEDLDCVSDALRMVIQLEGSEINYVFRGAVAATNSEFVRTVQAFETAETKHIAYICDQIPKFEASLTDECRNLRAAHLSDASG